MGLAACSSGGDASPTTTAAPPATGTSATTAAAGGAGPAVQQVIDIGGGQAYGLSGDRDNVWAVSFDTGTVARIDPASDSVTATVDLGSGAASAMSTEDDLWIAGYGGAPLFRIDPAAPSTIWVGLRRGGRVGSVREIDRATGEVLTELDDVDIPARIVLAFDSAWITDSGSSNVYRIGPVS